MSPRQRRFAAEYLIDLNGTQAAIRAGYKARSAAAQASRLLRRPDVAALLKDGMRDRSRRTGIEADQVLTELARIAFADLRSTAEWGPDGVVPRRSSDLDDDAARAVAEVAETRSRSGATVKVKLFDKRAALESLAKHLGLYDERSRGQMENRDLPALKIVIDGTEPAA